MLSSILIQVFEGLFIGTIVAILYFVVFPRVLKKIKEKKKKNR